jgi:ornithine--oxo-acid transaminase
MNVPYTRCEGVELWRADGKRVLDFLSGYCVHNTGHNHPEIIRALKEELDRCGPVMLQSHVPELAGELAQRLCQSAGGRLKKVHFTNSGSEGVETAIKFARAHTGRPGLLFAEGAFHGLTCGALSLMGNGFWREGFGPLLPEARQIPFGDLQNLEAELSTKRHAAFIVEPVQGEAGIRIPDPETSGRPSPSAGATAVCSFWMRFRRGCTARAASWQAIIMASTRTPSFSPKR